MYKFLLLAISLQLPSAFAHEKIEFKCKTKDAKPNNIDLRVKGSFKFGEKQDDGLVTTSQVRAHFNVKAEMDDSEIFEREMELDANYRMVRDDSITLDESVSGNDEQFFFKFIFLKDSPPSLILQVKNKMNRSKKVKCNLE